MYASTTRNEENEVDGVFQYPDRLNRTPQDEGIGKHKIFIMKRER